MVQKLSCLRLGHTFPKPSYSIMQALPPALRKEWRCIGDARNWTSASCVQDAVPFTNTRPHNKIELRRRRAEQLNTKCAICRSALAPEQCKFLPISDSLQYQLLSKRHTSKTRTDGWHLAPL